MNARKTFVKRKALVSSPIHRKCQWIIHEKGELWHKGDILYASPKLPSDVSGVEQHTSSLQANNRTSRARILMEGRSLLRSRFSSDQHDDKADEILERLFRHGRPIVSGHVDLFSSRKIVKNLLEGQEMS